MCFCFCREKQFLGTLIRFLSGLWLLHHRVVCVMDEGVGLDLTCVVVTSPTWANPALGLLPAVLDSFHLVR